MLPEMTSDSDLGGYDLNNLEIKELEQQAARGSICKIPKFRVMKAGDQ